MTLAAPRIAPSESDVVWRRGPVTLRRYRGRRAAALPLPVVLVPSIINRPYILDLRAGQSLVADLQARGLDVFLLDWGVPTRLDARLGLDDYAAGLLLPALAAARACAGAPAAHLLGYCLGGTFALVAAAQRAPGIASVVALTTPVDLGQPGAVGLLTDRALLDLERLAAACPLVPGELLWAAFQALDPVGIGAKWRGLQRQADDRELVARFVAQETWVADPVPVTARALSDVVERLYRRNELARGELVVRGRPARLADGRVPVLNLIAARDTIVPPPCSRPLAGLWGGEVETRELPGGHVGVTVGSRAPEQMWKVAGEWLVRRQAEVTP